MTQNKKNSPGTQQFTSMERKAIRLIAEGYTMREMSKLLKIPAKTIETLRNHLYQKCGVQSSAELMVSVMRDKLYQPKVSRTGNHNPKQISFFTTQEWNMLTLLHKGYRYNTIEKKLKLTPFVLNQDIDSITTKLKKNLEKENRVILTKEEIAIIRLTCMGHSLAAIAERIGDTAKNVNDHRQELYKKLQVSNTASLTVYAITRGIYKL